MPAATEPFAAPGQRRWLALGLAGAATAIVAALLVFDPTAPDSPLPPCPLHWATGLFCPGCGSTRALHALLHGDLATAMAMNPLLVVALPAIALLLAEQLGLVGARLQPLLRRVGDARPWLVLVLAYAVARNLPWWPFSWLAPGA